MQSILIQSTILLTICTIYINANSLLSRYYGEGRVVPVERHDAFEDTRVSDADVGMKSRSYIGTFGDRPIESRQDTGFIDQDGIPVPIIDEPVHRRHHHDHHIDYARFMARHGYRVHRE